MKGLFTKDFIGFKGLLKQSLPSLIFFLVIGYASKNPMFFTMMMGMLGLNGTFAAMGNNDASGFDAYSITFPIRKKDLVRERYIFSVVTVLVSTLVSTLLVGLTLLSEFEGGLPELLFSQLVLMAFLLFINYTIIPIIFKHGVEKARIALFLVTTIPFVLIMLLSFLDIKLPGLSAEINVGLVSAITLGACVILGLISEKISEVIVEKKDF